MAANRDLSIAIIGAGPGGLCAGIRLQQAGCEDFVILEKDPHDVDPDAIKEIQVVQTVMGGRTTYEA